jgi:hypothetical protein
VGPSKALLPVPGPVFLHIYFGNDNKSEGSRISLKLCDTVTELLSRIDDQIPDSLAGRFTNKIRVELGQSKFRISKGGELGFEALLNFLDDEGCKGDLKPVGYAELVGSECL